jgi:hypothetical protein
VLGKYIRVKPRLGEVAHQGRAGGSGRFTCRLAALITSLLDVRGVACW